MKDEGSALGLMGDGIYLLIGMCVKLNNIHPINPPLQPKTSVYSSSRRCMMLCAIWLYLNMLSLAVFL